MRYDHIILGSGQATGTLLGKLIPTGQKIAVIEGNTVGGSCVNYGCTPTKTLVACAKALHQARRGDFFGFQTGEIKVDFPRVMERMNEVRHASRDGLTGWIESTDNVDLIRGYGEFISSNQIKVNDQVLEGGNIYINVGTRPSAPPIQGLETVNWLDSAGLLDTTELPENLVVVGGGYIGVEFAQVFRRLGSEVTLIQRDNQLMPREDKDVADAIQEFLEEEGIRVLLNTEAKRVKEVEKQIEIEVNDEIITASHLLIATGRTPNSDKIGAEAAGLELNERGFIKVDDFCRTNLPNVFAVGDVNGEGAFTHTAVNDAEIVLDYLFDGLRTLSSREIVYGLFTDPPLGRVGMTDKEALATGRRVLKATRPMSKISRAKEMGETKGFAKLLVDADTDLILGASILGVGGDEIINMFAAIMHSNIPCKNYRRVVLVHPTVSELMPWILDGIKEASEKA
ncbi:MAG: mercuric reductase [Bacteroidota bacterium]